MTNDILADAREFIGDRHERLQTHSEGCWRWHPACMVGLLAREVERLRTIMHRIVDEDCTVAIQGGTFYADGEPLFAVERTPATQPTPGECSTPGEGTSEPVSLGAAHRMADAASACGPGDAKRLGAANSGDDRRSVGGGRTHRISGGDERTNHDERQRGAVRCIRWLCNTRRHHMDWMLPELPPEALARDRSIASQLTRVTKVIDEDWPDAHAAWLTVGPQHFKVTVCETREEAGWHCWMLAKAMMVVIDSAVGGIGIVEGPKVA